MLNFLHTYQCAMHGKFKLSVAADKTPDYTAPCPQQAECRIDAPWVSGFKPQDSTKCKECGK